MKMKMLLAGFLMFVSITLGAKPPANLQERLEQWNQGQPGGVAVAWVDADGTAFFQTGQFDAGDPRPITPDTQFELGSVTKVFTALLLAESERAGKVRRDDSAAKHLLPADDPAQAGLRKITLLSLTTHTSGLPQIPANFGAGASSGDPYAAYGREELLQALRSDGVAASGNAPATYSNFGVALLGQALASAWGTSYADALRAHVLAPLGLEATVVPAGGQEASENLAPPHVGAKRVPAWTFEACAPAGALRSSARDMARFVEACLGRRPVLQEALQASFVPQRNYPDFKGSRIALGWIVSGGPEQPILWHNGLTRGSHAFVGISAQTGAGVVILANTQKGPEALGFGLLGSAMPQAPSNAVDNASDYPGRYPLNAAFALTITAADGLLFCQGTGQPRVALRPVGKDRFSIVGVPAEISFERDASGQVVALTLHQNGRDQRAARGALPAAPKPVTLPAATLAQYPGSYPLLPDFVLIVTIENGGVFVQATGQAKFPVYASAPDEFYYTVVEARISFTRDAAGKVDGLVLHQNGQDMPAKRRSP